jgi:hypothetical protein
MSFYGLPEFLQFFLRDRTRARARGRDRGNFSELLVIGQEVLSLEGDRVCDVLAGEFQELNRKFNFKKLPNNPKQEK